METEVGCGEEAHHAMRQMSLSWEAAVFYSLLVATLLLLPKNAPACGLTAGPECNGTSTVKLGEPFPIASMCPWKRTLVVVYSDTCPACQDDAQDLLLEYASLIERDPEFGLLIIMAGEGEPTGAIAGLLLLPRTAMVTDRDRVYASELSLRGVPYYVFCDSGLVQWCQEGRSTNTERTKNFLCHRLVIELGS